MELNSNQASVEERESAPLSTSEVTQNEKLPETADLASIVEESKATLAEADQVPVKQRRKRRTKAEMEASRAGDAGAVGSAVQPAGVTAEAKELSEMLQFAGHLAANRTGFDGWKVEASEADLHGSRLDRCFKKWMPQMSEGTLLLGSTILGLGFAVGMRAISYQDWRKTNAEKSKSGNTTSSTNGQDGSGRDIHSVGQSFERESTSPAVSVDQFFPREH